MSYLAMSAASLDNNEFNFNNNNNNGTNSINRKRQKTLKSRSPQEFNPQKVNSVLKSIHQNTDGDGDDDDEEDTYPYNNNKGSPFPAKPISMGAERKKVEEGMTNRQSSLVPQPMDKEAWTTQDLQQAFMNDGQVRDYYRKVLSSSSPSVASSSYKATTTNSSVSGSNDIMIEKLNYLINLLEEQQDQKTESVAEEVVLYSFLGIFIIFVVDSFSRVGKYVR